MIFFLSKDNDGSLCETLEGYITKYPKNVGVFQFAPKKVTILIRPQSVLTKNAEF